MVGVPVRQQVERVLDLLRKVRVLGGVLAQSVEGLIEQAGCQIDQLAGVSRPGFNAARRACRRGDTLVVWKLDRLGRSLLEVLTVCEELKARGVGLRIITESIDTETVMGRFMLHLLASLAELERGLIIERTKAGLASARARGRIGGRIRTVTAADERRAIKMLRAGEPVPVVARHLGVSRSLIYQRARGEWAPRIAAVKEDDDAT